MDCDVRFDVYFFRFALLQSSISGQNEQKIAETIQKFQGFPINLIAEHEWHYRTLCSSTHRACVVKEGARFST